MISLSDYTEHWDPYDLWAVSRLGALKAKAFSTVSGFVGAGSIAATEMIAPEMVRTFLQVPKHRFPTTLAMLAMAQRSLDAETAQALVVDLERMAVKRGKWVAWGLPFAWFSKNGVYAADTPYITYTPYVMALLSKLPDAPGSKELFDKTWGFLESLRVMHSDSQSLALSYAPVSEPRTVVNANSYAVWAYAMHAVYGTPDVHLEASNRALRIARWIAQRQLSNGQWLYYDDDQAGNFIDTFHSCFIVRNLRLACELLPEITSTVAEAVSSGSQFIIDKMYDTNVGFARRFVFRNTTRDFFHWDLYDQAEFLGLLIDLGEYEQAARFADHVEMAFRDGDDWYCRIDVLGRKWGRNFLRWGIVPFWYHQGRLQRALVAQERG